MDKKHRKKLKRKAKAKSLKQKSEEAQKKLQKRINLFEKLPEQCSACNKTFPKTKESHMTWKVVVRSNSEVVRLFCPDCQNKVTDFVEGQDEI
tara:strand:+ start:511 stop:789 length:279 start_codon:yes stop_codon:yes gene_type:complete